MIVSLTSAAVALTHIALNVVANSPVVFDGCVETGPGPVCVMETGSRITLWVDRQATDLPRPVYNGRALIPEDAIATSGGTRFTLSLPTVEGTLSLQEDPTKTTLQLTIRHTPEVTASALTRHALEELSPDEALVMLNAALVSASPEGRTELLRTKARLHTRRDEHEIAQGVFRAAIENARLHGQHYTAMRSAAALAFSLRHHQRNTEAAERVMADVADLAGAHGASRYLWFYHRGMAALTAENARDQLRFFEQAASTAQRTNQPARELRADTLLALVQQSLGQREAAGARLADWAQRLPNNLPACERASFWANLGWNSLLELEAQESADSPIANLERALVIIDEHCDITEKVNSRINLGLAYWHRNDLDRAQQYLDDARSLTQNPATHLAYWAMDLDGRIQTSRGEFDGALDQYALLAQRAEDAQQPATTWRARVRQAWTLRLAGRHDEAIEMHRAAEHALDDQVLRVPLQAGRESLLAVRRFAMREHLGLLQKNQQFEEALALMRRESSRAIEQLHIAARINALDPAGRAQWDRYRQSYERLRAAGATEQATSWQLSRTQLEELNQRSAQRERQLRQLLDQGVSGLNATRATNRNGHSDHFSDTSPLLGIWQTSNGWSMLLDQGAGVVGFTPECPAVITAKTRNAVAACLMQSVAPELGAANTLALLVDDALADVDWHSLPIGTAQWVDRLALRYVSGLPVSMRATPAPGLALIVGDPSGNLRAARDEAGDVQQRLRTHSEWQDDTLLGERAERGAVRSRLENAALFHYAGHAAFGDNSGWESALLLANNTQLSVGDILTLEGTPQLVVLSGCETARRAGGTTPAIGLAHAFLASGSSAVLATTRSVDDRSARAVVRAFYDYWLAGQPVHHALRAAQRQTRDEHPELDWSAFRIIEP